VRDGQILSRTDVVWLVNVDNKTLPLRTELHIQTSEVGDWAEFAIIAQLKDINEPVEISAPIQVNEGVEWTEVTDPELGVQITDYGESPANSN
jgi:hypothetical protein